MTEASERVESQKERAILACIAFANTVNNYHADSPTDVLNSYTDLVRWAQEAEVLSAREAKGLLEKASHRQAEAESVLKDAKLLRRTIYSIFSNVAHMQAPSDEDIAELNSRLTKVLSHSQISQQGGDFFWDWEDKSNDLDGVLWSMVRCAANL
ncbi:MAG: ABATE domain-containing protein, partial [Phycisphaerales bacterium]